MRPIIPVLACVAIGLSAACGSSSSDGSGRTVPTQVNLRLTIAGNGLVRGAATDCRGSCTSQYALGSQVHLLPVPDSGATFVGWAGACSGIGACDLTLDADRDVSATFAAAPPPPEEKRRLTVIVQGKGRVTSTPAGIDCDSSTCSADFASGTSVTLNAQASSGYGFNGWGTDCTGSAGCSISLSRDATVYANFAALPPPPPAQVRLSASTTGPGTISGGGLNCGESTSTCDATVASGSTVTLTASPAGGARFAGWGGACSGAGGNCQLTVQSDTKVSATFMSEVLALATNDGANGANIALNSTHVFWNRYTNNGSGIWKVPKNGGEAVRVAGGYGSAIVADDAYLYWTDGTNLHSTPVGGGEVALLASQSPIGKLVLDEVGALYWTVNSSYNTAGSAHRMENRADKVLASGLHPNGAVAVDATYLYFTDYDGINGSVRRVPRAGGTPEELVKCSSNYCSFQAVRADPEFVYYRDNTGTVFAYRKSDKKVSVLSGGNSTASWSYSADVDVNGSVVFWNWTGGSGPYGIFRANSDGTGFKAVDTSNDQGWYGLRVDDTAVYYWHGGAIIRRLR
jgi:hypothetical protein